MKIQVLSLLVAAILLFSACSSPAVAISPAPSLEELALSEESVSPLPPEPEPSSQEESVVESKEEPESSVEESILPEETMPAVVPDKKPSTTESLSGVPTITDEYITDRLTTPLSQLQTLDNTVITWGPGVTSGEVRPVAPLDLQAKYGEYGAWFIAPSDNRVYLTFDEGYDAGYNGEILDVLQRKNTKALFFITLGFAQSRPDLIRRMVDEGHMLGNHSWRHISFPTMDLMDCAKDVMALHEFILDNFGYEMTVCRPPEGAFSTRSLALLDSLGYQSLFWSFAYRDWILDEQPNANDALATILGRSHPGAIYLLHAVSSTNALILPDIIDQLREKGYDIALWQ